MKREMKRWILGASLLLTIVVSGCGAAQREATPEVEKKVLTLEQQRDQVLVEARAFFAIWTEGDIESMVSRTHPTVIVSLGGPKSTYTALEKVLAEMEHSGATTRVEPLEPPATVVASAGKLYAIQPYALVMTAPEKAAMRSSSYLIGESHDGGHRWYFIDGRGVKGDRGQLRLLLPDFPAALELPEATLAPVAPAE